MSTRSTISLTFRFSLYIWLAQLVKAPTLFAAYACMFFGAWPCGKLILTLTFAP